MDQGLKHRINAGRVAVKNQIDFFRKQFGLIPSEWKEDETRVTFVDFAISERVHSEISRTFPEDMFCSEESSPLDEVIELSSRFSWILDPIDGTNNYAIGIPICAISLALLKDGIPVYGFIYDFGRDRLIEGGPRYGVWDGRRRCVRPKTPIGKQSIVGLSFPLEGENATKLRPVFESFHIRSMGSAALNLAYSAIGMIDGCLDYRVKIWDFAAAMALCRGGGR